MLQSCFDKPDLTGMIMLCTCIFQIKEKSSVQLNDKDSDGVVKAMEKLVTSGAP